MNAQLYCIAITLIIQTVGCANEQLCDIRYTLKTGS